MTVNAGEVELDLGGEVLVLRSTLRAAKMVSSMHGGFVGVYQKMATADFDAMVSVIAAGLDYRGSKLIGELEQKVYSNGMASLIAPLSRYVALLSNGGRPPPDEVAEGAAAEPGNG